MRYLFPVSSSVCINPHNRYRLPYTASLTLLVICYPKFALVGTEGEGSFQTLSFFSYLFTHMNGGTKGLWGRRNHVLIQIPYGLVESKKRNVLAIHSSPSWTKFLSRKLCCFYREINAKASTNVSPIWSDVDGEYGIRCHMENSQICLLLNGFEISSTNSCLLATMYIVAVVRCVTVLGSMEKRAVKQRVLRLEHIV
ncbi:HAT dimerization domain-containing protein isoform 2 [Gossypium australe]|uniref:HAT dimerization domain-containing protein isoform 2 n=1 Tax=Gossypium australe TaxID=47621 RepID=A0A5B6UWA6_9ROSI|nr:HAT dimerization domain-containing protein isoform 2 [Gossypium australe]